MAKISRRKLAATTVRLLARHPEKRQAIIRSLAAYMVLQRQAKQLDLFIKDLARELQTTTGAVLARVHSAHKLDEATRTGVTAYLQQQIGAKTVELDEVVEPNLIGGVTMQTADLELDTTVRTKLRRLASLNSGGNE
jgi:F-type H+-transporting ATPase subunit delta